MTTKPEPQTFRVERSAPTLDALRKQGITARHLEAAQQLAKQHGLTVTSDLDALRQLRARGIDPARGLDAEQASTSPIPAQIGQSTSNDPARDIAEIRRDMARRRQAKARGLALRLLICVGLPTLLAGWYFFAVATPMFATHSEFVIQQADSPSGAGAGANPFTGASGPMQRDSTTVQSYLTSRAALARLDADHGFKAHFSSDQIDPLQRLGTDASDEETFRTYQDSVRISFDPTEGIVRMEVVAADPATSETFSKALLDYAEDRVEQLTRRLRDDQMDGARQVYEDAEARRQDTLATLLNIQTTAQQIDPQGETAARIQQISTLESQRQQVQLTLQSRLSVTRPNEAQVNNLRAQIADLDSLIGQLRRDMTSNGARGGSLAANSIELRLAEENYAFQTSLVQQALQQMEAARIDANRQVRYLLVGVEPIAPDEATYPRAWENTLLAFLLCAGLYLMISLTFSILREQVSA